MAKTPIKYFVSYAHKTDTLARCFLGKLDDELNLSPKYQFEKWIDGDIIVGDDWDDQIQRAIAACDVGLLLLSSAYFNRRYIRENELPHFIKDNAILKPIVPVGIQTFNLSGDLLGLEKAQIFRYQRAAGAPCNFYNELQSTHRLHFVSQLVAQFTRKLDNRP
jgi:hypothetical protein